VDCHSQCVGLVADFSPSGRNEFMQPIYLKPHPVAPNIFSVLESGAEIKCATEILDIKGNEHI